MWIFDERGAAFAVGKELARGGQGTVLRLDGTDEHLVKVYHQQPTARDKAKQLLLRSASPLLGHVAALPISLAFSDATVNSHSGVFLPFVGGVEIFELYGIRSRIERFPKANFQFLVRVAYNLASAFEELHRQGIVVGDVNEQNIKVLPDATVRFIDTDSFQIRNCTEVYTSDVGTPLWTAPELHGLDLTGLERTQNHDLFGLAQLIFLILFAGRNPFSGVPKTEEYLLPEEAIRRHAFAFAPEHLNSPLGPPPHAPKLEMLPPDMQAAFMQAFMHESVLPDARPTARFWREQLEILTAELVGCPIQSSHLYWGDAEACPWCAFLEETGIDIFPVPVDVIHLTVLTEEDDALIRRAAGLRPRAFIRADAPVIHGLKPSPFPEAPKGVKSGISNLFAVQQWRQAWLGEPIRRCKTLVQQAEREILSNLSQQQKIIVSYNHEYIAKYTTLTQCLHAFTNIAALRAKAEQTVRSDGRQSALLRYLEQYPIRKQRFRSVNSSHLAAIQSFGIETAADITTSALSRVHMPLDSVSELMEWRRQKEAAFTYDPNHALSSIELQQVEDHLQLHLSDLRLKAETLETELNEFTEETELNLMAYAARIQDLARQRDQARLDLRVMEQEMYRP